MTRRNEVNAEVRQLTSGFWAVFIGGNWVDAASLSEETARAKLKKLTSENTDAERSVPSCPA